MKRPPEAWVSAADAVRLMQVTRATLYAYVSRGFIRSEATTGASRARRYARDDVERMVRRGEERRQPDKVAAHAMQWGLPVLESSITLIAEGRLYYRGHDAVQLARTRSVEEVASLIWTGRFDGRLSATTGRGRRAAGRRSTPAESSFTSRAQCALAGASVEDLSAFDLRPDAVARTGWKILRRLTNVAGPAPSTTSSEATEIDELLARAWKVRPAGVAVLRAALILCADHELNVSAFTARCVASSGSNPYAVVIAGLAALEGIRHGGMTVRVEAMLASLRRERRLDAVLAERLRLGERVDGFGHPLYRGGDPRAAALLDMLRERYPKSPELRFVNSVAMAAKSLAHEAPNLDFALGAVSRVLELPRGSGLTLFAIGRTIGWIGQAMEQYDTAQMIRPRAKYVGVVPSL